MADRPSNTPEGGEMIIDKTSDEYFEPILTSEDNDLINETIAYIDRTVSTKALEASLLIGGYIRRIILMMILRPHFQKIRPGNISIMNSARSPLPPWQKI